MTRRRGALDPQPLFLTHHDGPLGRCLLVASDQGLCASTLPGTPDAGAIAHLRRYMPGAILIQESPRLAAYLGALDRYWSSRTLVSPPLHLLGTPFQRQVWQALMRIPAGQTCSYGDVAHLIGRPGAARAVGAACGVNPLPLFVPCHRVLGAGGKMGGFGGGLPLKRALLLREGVDLDAMGIESVDSWSG
jgi:O-6-methylguanine DNA methyltransferase